MSESLEKLRIALITNMPSPYQVDLFNAIAELKKIRLRVYYLRKQSYGRLWNNYDNIKHEAVFVREIRLHKHLYLSPGTYKAVLQWKPDLMVISQYASIAMQILMWSNGLLKRPWVFWSERPTIMGALADPIVTHKRIRQILRKIALFPVKRWPTAIWSIGTTARQIYTELTNGSIKVENFPYHSDLAAFLRIQRSDKYRAPVRFLFSGNLEYRKGFDTLVAAVSHLTEVTNEFEVFVMGHGSQKELVDMLPDTVRRHFHLLGFKQMKDVPEVYANCDVLVFPSRYDGWGLSVVEAMAAQMPVIGSKDAGACIDLISEGVNGYLIDAGDSTQLWNKMLDFIRNPAQIAVMGQLARQVSIPFDASTGAARFIDLLADVLQIQ